ncbi:MAG: ParB/RepB/Spo0J family partition protein [bacterium]|nr:ParB/RepB/Spo0J family partition protein [bacterium]
MAVRNRGLGRGLESLFSENAQEATSVVELRVSEIEPNADQPRRFFDEESLAALSDSIKKHGVIQPLLVRPMSSGRYEIIAGERRWRASRMAGIEKVPVVVRETEEKQAAQLALIENLQREDLNPIEEALGYKKLIDTYSLTQEQVAESVGKSRPAVANSLRLLGLSEAETECLINGNISVGHARALLSFQDQEQRTEAFELAKSGCTVREIERLLQKRGSKGVIRPSSQKKNKLFEEVEIALTKEIGRRVKVNGNLSVGTIQVEFFGEQDLYDLARRIAGENK